MRVYDCSDPGAAFEISSVDIPIFHMFQSINSYDLQLVGDQIFLLNSSNDGTFRYFAYDVSDPMNPVSEGDFVSPYPMSKTGAFSDDLAIFAIQEPERGFEIFDISEMFDSPRGEYIFKTGVIHPNGMLYQIDGTFGTSVELQAFDISDPINPLMVSESPASYQWLGKPEPCGDDYLLSVRPDSGLLIFDVSNPNEIELAGSVALPSFMFQFGANFGYEVVGELMYYYHSDDGVSIVDLSNTALPMVIGHINFGNTQNDEPRDITGRDGYAYVMLYNSDMVTLDLSDPTNPIEADRLATDWTFVPLSDRLVYGDGMIAHVNRNTMDFYDVQNPDSPVFMSRYDGGTSSDFLITPHIEGDRAYVATQQDPFFTAVYDRAPDFLMLDISDPTMPLVIGGHETRLATGVYDAQYVEGSVYLSVNPSLEEVFLIEGCNVCLADLTGDGMLNFFDVSAFLSAFAAGCL